MKHMCLRRLSPIGLAALLAAHATIAPAADWPDWRGPRRDGTSTESNLPSSWSPAGDNLAWKVPYGGRSAPIVLGGRVFLQTHVGEGETLQERVIAFDAETGRLVWEHRMNLFMSDVPPHRIGWASPVGDPTTERVYALAGGGLLVSLSNDGRLLWERSLGEEFGLVTTHGGRTVSPVIEGHLVIVSGIASGWGSQARGGQRFFAFDKMTGETVWVSAPGGRPYDTTYAPPIAAVIHGTRLLIAGGSDGRVHALKPQTGEAVWSYEISKRGLNTGVVLAGTTAFASHGEENIGTSEMGHLSAFDAASEGTIGPAQIKWTVPGFLGGYSSPVLDGSLLYQVSNAADLTAFDIETGTQRWTFNLGTIQKSSPVLADGKLYVGSENGKFYILEPGADGCTVLDEDQIGTETAPEAITGSPAVAGGRVYVVTTEALYAIGPATPRQAPEAPRDTEEGAADGPTAHVQIVPTEIILAPGESVDFEARLFDGNGRFLRTESASWALTGLEGTLDENGGFVPAASAGAQAGEVTGTVGPLSGVARVRVVPPLPWTYDFDAQEGEAPPSHWINATGKYVVRDLDGSNVLVKLNDNPFTKRARLFMGPVDLADYTIEADVRGAEARRRMGDVGVVAQRYALILRGNHQRLELEPWQPETERTATVSFSWKPDAWYRLKLRVENQPDGTVLARGKVWPRGEAEPVTWTIERTDPIGNRMGSPGIYADAIESVFVDNLTVKPNTMSSGAADQP